MVFEAGGSSLEGGSFELISSLICYRIRSHVRQFLQARPSEARCFPPGRAMDPRPIATHGPEHMIECQIGRQNRFARSFSAPFRGFFVLHCHGVWGWRIPCFGGLEGGSFELISSLICYRISEATLGSFSAPFRGFVVLHCHGVWGWRIPCFDCDGVWLLVWVMILKKTLPIGGQLMLGYWPPLGINVLSKKKTWFGGKSKIYS